MSAIHRDSCDLTIVVIFLVYSLYVSTICFAELSVMLLLASGSSKVFGGVSGIYTAFRFSLSPILPNVIVGES